MTIFTIEDVKEINGRGPWSTKSDGQLTVLFTLPFNQLAGRFLHYDVSELGKIPPEFDIRGLRIYSVQNVPAGNIGGTEFHRIREEIVFCLEGRMIWTCEDLRGETRSFRLKPGMGVWAPPYILHTYEAMEEGSIFLVLCNTLFDPADPRTHDSYSAEEFRQLQKEIKSQ